MAGPAVPAGPATVFGPVDSGRMPSFASGLRFERIVVPTPFAVGPANVYLIPASPVTLVDCGPNTPATERALFAGLRAAGVQPGRVERVVISHGHPDHFGLASRLQGLSGARVLVGERDLPKLASDRSMLTATGRLLLRAGMPMEALVEMGERERGLGDLRPRVERPEPLAGGEVLRFSWPDGGGFELEVLHLPGHTAGHVCLYDRGSGVLFAGDTLLPDVSPNPLIEPDPMDPDERRQSLVEYLRSLDVLAGLPLATVFPGHGEPIEDPHGLIERMRAHHRRRVEDLASRLGDRPKTGWDLALELFRDLQGFDNFLAVSEVVAHMDLLVRDGRAHEVTLGSGATAYVSA